MNTPNPLIPQGALERHSRGKSTVRIAILTIVSIHAVFFAGLLMQGCRHDEARTPLKTAEATNQTTLPGMDNSYYPAAQDFAAVVTNPPPNAATPTPPAEAGSALPTSLPTEPVIDGKPYTIVKGDTLARIAKANGLTVGAISKANPTLDPAKLKPGQKIQLPGAATSTAPGLGFAEPAKAEAGPASAQVYSVKAGETLTRIAKRHGTTIKAIRAANHLKSDRLVVGQKLKIPASTSAALSAEPSKPAAVSKVAASTATATVVAGGGNLH